MKIEIDSGRIEEKEYELIVAGLLEDGPPRNGVVQKLDQDLGGAISNIFSTKEFRGRLNESYLIPTFGRIKSKRILAIGLGKKSGLSLETIRLASGKAARIVRDLAIENYCTLIYNYGLPILDTVQSLVEGAELALYRFNRYKSSREPGEVEVKVLTILAVDQSIQVQKSANSGGIISKAVNFARDLSNTPGNECTPRSLGNTAKRIASELGFSCEVLGKEKIKRLGLGGLLAVSKGSQEPPRFIIMKYEGGRKDDAPLVFVGKGVTFDSGGISIKPSDRMDEMKFDKSGACAAIATIRAIVELKLPVNVVVLVPATENLPGGSATKPGDVVRFYGGKTAEIVNTDAEGRLILSDALAYATTFKPKAVIDLATLTGACVVALGAFTSGLFTNDSDLKEKILQASEKTGEKVWELPLWKEYTELLKSEVADMKNTGGRTAGAITAAMFLKSCIGDYPWAHLDIAGTAWVQEGTIEKSYQPKGATGFGVRLLVELARLYS